MADDRKIVADEMQDRMSPAQCSRPVFPWGEVVEGAFGEDDLCAPCEGETIIATGEEEQAAVPA